MNDIVYIVHLHGELCGFNVQSHLVAKKKQNKKNAYSISFKKVIVGIFITENCSLASKVSQRNASVKRVVCCVQNRKPQIPVLSAQSTVSVKGANC